MPDDPADKSKKMTQNRCTVAAPRNQDATILKKAMRNNKTQATVDSLIDQISKLVALIAATKTSQREAENRSRNDF
jgi:hypothetical protein